MTAVVIRRRALQAEPIADLHPVLARVLAARGIGDREELNLALAGLAPPGIAGLDAAVDRLQQAIEHGESILVVGDFDADGATSTALAVRALRMFGHARVDYLVPNRFDFGYGLTRELIAAVSDCKPDLILTVDNGVSSHDGVAAATEQGIAVVVTDHHLPPPALPPAAAVVNPNRTDCTFPSKNLAGVGVVFYVLAALRSRLSAARGNDQLASMADLLDLVALGTVADVVPLDRNNRILVEQGLKRLRAGRGTPGVQQLLRAARRDPAQVTATDLGYAVAPRLNAAGRIADMAVGIEALLAEDNDSARKLASRLDDYNRDRRTIEAEMKEQADAEVERLRASLAASEQLPSALVLHDARWHQGVSGILAGRLRQTVHRPIVILADAGEGMLKGSCRSIPGLHIRDLLATIDAAEPGLLERFGGHAMAAGLTLAADRLETFRERFCTAVHERIGDEVGVREILTDGVLAADELTMETAETLRSATPWGAGFPPPVFEGLFRVHDHRVVGEHHLKLQVEAIADQTSPDAGCGEFIEAMAFHADPALHNGPGPQVRLVYRLEVNEFRGRRNLQLVIEHLEPMTHPVGH